MLPGPGKPRPGRWVQATNKAGRPQAFTRQQSLRNSAEGAHSRDPLLHRHEYQKWPKSTHSPSEPAGIKRVCGRGVWADQAEATKPGGKAASPRALFLKTHLNATGSCACGLGRPQRLASLPAIGNSARGDLL